MNESHWLRARFFALRSLGTRVRNSIAPELPVTRHGQGLVEYALIVALIAIVVLGVLSSVGDKTSTTFSQVNCVLGGAPTTTSSHPGNPQGNGGGLSNNTTTTGGC